MNKIYLLALLLILGVGESYAQKKIGVVDVQRVMDSLPSRRIAIAEIQEFTVRSEQELQTMDSILDIMNREKTYNGKEIKEETIKAFADRMNSRQKQVEEELTLMVTNCEKDSREKVDQAAAVVVKKMKLEAFYSKDNLVYAGKTVDITEQVIAEVQKTSQK